MSPSTLVQIEPLSQSGYEQMACGFGYRAVRVHRKGRAGSIWAEFGLEVHRVVADYVEHLAETRQSTDYDHFNALAVGVRPETRESLDRIRDGLVINPEKVLGAEQYIGLDKNFALVVMERVHGEHRSGGDPRIEYEGTLDLVVLESPREAEISDWKNQFLIAAPESFQSHFYPLLLFCALPSLEVVTFRLEYVRWGVGRTITFTREDVPRLKRMAQAARNRQRKLVQMDREPKPTPHKGCTYCPLLLDGCPMDKASPYAKLSAKERLRLQIYLDAALKLNQALLKEWAERAPVSICDENGSTYTGTFVPRKRTRYALEHALPIVDAWDRAHPDDRLRPRLMIGASELNELAKAKEKRPELADTLTSVAEVTPYSEFQISVEAPKSRARKSKSSKSSAK